jgi:guanylate kinase
MRPDLVFSISCTTRPPRPGEVDGRDYRFVSPMQFDELVEEGAFLEWAGVFGHRYGTLIGPIADALEAGRDVLLEIDVQGARSVRDRFPDAVLFFVVPPSPSHFLQQLEERLRKRGSESEAEVARRLAAAREEMEEAHRFDHVVVNDRIDRAAAEVAAIIDETGTAPTRSSR